MDIAEAKRLGAAVYEWRTVEESHQLIVCLGPNVSHYQYHPSICRGTRLTSRFLRCGSVSRVPRNYIPTDSVFG